MAEDRIDSIIDIPAIQAELKILTEGIDLAYIGLKKFAGVKVTLEGADSVMKLSAASKEYVTSLDEVTSATVKNQGARKKMQEMNEEELRVSIRKTEAHRKVVAEIKAENDAYKKLVLEYTAAATAAKALGAQHGLTSEQFKKSAIHANELSEKLKAIDAATGQHQRNVGHYTSVIDELGHGFKKVAERVVEFASVYAIFNFFKDTVKEALEADKALHRFEGTLAALGRMDAFARLIEQTHELQERFKVFDHVEITGVFEKLVTFGKLTENQIKSVTPVILDLSSKLGIDLAEATKLVTGGIEGTGKEIKKTFGIDMKEGHNEAERFNIIMTKLKDKVDGATDAFGGSNAGKIKAMEVNFKDLKEEIGTGLLPALVNILSVVNDTIKGFGLLFKGIRNGLNDFRNGTDHNQLHELYAEKDAKDFASGVEESIERVIKKLNLSVEGSAIKRKELIEKAVTKAKEDYAKGLNDFKAGLIDSGRLKFLELSAEHLEKGVFRESSGNKVLGNSALKDEDKDKQNQIDASLKRADEFHKRELAIIEKANKEELENLKAKYKEIADDQEKSYAERLVAEKLYSDTGIKLIAQKKADEEAQLRNDTKLALKGAITKKEIDAIEYLRKARQHEIDNSAILATENLQVEVSKKFTLISEQNAKKIDKAYTDAYKHIKGAFQEAFNNESAGIKLNKAAELKALNARYQSGEINAEENGKAKLEIEDKYANLLLKKHEEFLVNQQLVNEQFGENDITLLEQYANDEITLEELKNKKKADSDKKASDERKKLLEAEKALTKEAFGVIGKYIDDNFNSQISNLQYESKLIDEKSKKELDAVNASGLSQAEKARRVSEIEKKAAFDKEQLSKREHELQLRKAKFDKEKGILEIIVKTAEAVMNYAANPVTAPLVPYVIGLGAAELAAAIAAPLPKFEKGTDNAPRGLAIVSEKGRELVVPRSGKPYFTPDTMSMISLSGGERIIPHDLIANIMATVNPLSMSPQYAPVAHQSKIDNPFAERTLDVLKSIDRKADRPINVELPIEATAFYDFHFKH